MTFSVKYLGDITCYELTTVCMILYHYHCEASLLSPNKEMLRWRKRGTIDILVGKHMNQTSVYTVQAEI